MLNNSRSLETPKSQLEFAVSSLVQADAQQQQDLQLKSRRKLEAGLLETH